MKTKFKNFARYLQISHRLFCPLAIVIISLALGPAMAHGAEVTLEWDANTEPDLHGYVIYLGTSSGDYSDSNDVGNTTEATISGLEEGVTYSSAATAYDTSDNESDFSNEISHTVSGATSGSGSSSSGSGGGVGCFISAATNATVTDWYAGWMPEARRPGLVLQLFVLGLVGAGGLLLLRIYQSE